MDEILWCYHSNKTSSAVLSHGTIYVVCTVEPIRDAFTNGSNKIGLIKGVAVLPGQGQISWLARVPGNAYTILTCETLKPPGLRAVKDRF